MDYQAVLSELRVWFREYIAAFDRSATDVRINFELKEQHSYRVCMEMRDLAASLALPPEDAALAEIAALMHDVGRFEQYYRHHSFMDVNNIDHGNLGVEVLRRHRPLDRLPEAAREEVIAAVGAHNKLHIPAGLTPRALRFTRMLRDADKLDIWRVVLEFYRGDRSNPAIKLNLSEEATPSPTVYRAILSGRPADKNEMRNVCDFQLTQMAWVYDLNFPLSRQHVKDRGYLQQIYACMRGGAEVDRIFARTFSYLCGQSGQ